MEKRDARSIPPAAQERVRHLAVKAVLGGKKQVEVARIFGVTRQAVGKWRQLQPHIVARYFLEKHVRYAPA